MDRIGKIPKTFYAYFLGGDVIYAKLRWPELCVKYIQNRRIKREFYGFMAWSVRCALYPVVPVRMFDKWYVKVWTQFLYYYYMMRSKIG